MKLKNRMFSLLLSSCFIASCGAAQQNEKILKMPDATTLQKRLNEAGFEHFVEKTDIVKNLADRDLYPLGVAVSVETALYDYSEYLKQPMMARMMQMRKPQLLEVLLKDHPAALQELADEGVYKK